ncbi:DNA polymerase alpha subunit A [Nematocida major]|uniref:DNA polymerase alpha subunit A n=1 Tax=Nematocida major TaxID=1912982 RepID=UPI0020072B32|nr:DNA polymerase alpha subunit A [Nematocida major]KAH9385428.1 DNA polymerase alpha subunit A [Nematocida major]
MDVHVLNITACQGDSVSLQCIRSDNGQNITILVTDIVNEISAAPITEEGPSMSRLESEVSEVFSSSLVPVSKERACVWDLRSICLDRDTMQRGKPEKRLIFHLPYGKASGIIDLDTSNRVVKAFSSPMEAFILLKKIKGPTLLRIRNLKNGAARMDSVETISYGMPSMRIAYVYASQKDSFETVSVCVYSSAFAQDCAELDRAEGLSAKKQKTEPAAEDAFLRHAGGEGLCSYWTFTCLETDASPAELLSANISKLPSASAVASRVLGFLREWQASMVVSHNMDAAFFTNRAAAPGGAHASSTEKPSERAEVSLVCDLPKYVESVNKLAEYTLDEICKAYGVSYGDAPVQGGLSVSNEARLAIEAGGASTRFSTLLNASRACSALMCAVFRRGGLLELAEKLARVTGALLNPIFNGYKSDRVEYLLLHRMRENKYLIPKRLLGERADDKDTYEGGHVFLEKPGMYSGTYVALFDFNSLYPSIIQEYNVCFSTLHRLSMSEPDTEAPSLLPGVLRDLVLQRAGIKKKIAMGEGNPQALEIEQRAVKLVANCVYGCLGFKGFRFYNKKMAAFITECGRNILKDTKSTLEQKGYAVIYGDTDSVMVDTGIKTTEPAPSGELLLEISKCISGKYRCIKLGFEKVFLKLVMLAKKKYFGVYLSDGREKVEEKGLETGRRDWCEAARSAIGKAVHILLYSAAPEKEMLCMLSKTKESFKSLGKEHFLIRKKIQKAPESYGPVQAGALHQVALALRLKQEKGLVFHGGDIISFVMALHHGSLRPEHILESGQVCCDYYMKMQVLPPIQRILEHFPAISLDSVQKVLGLHRPASVAVKSAPNVEAVSPEILDALSISPKCCGKKQTIGMACSACEKAFSLPYIKTLARSVIFKQVSALYAPKRKCEKCKIQHPYSPVCMLCMMPMQWEVPETEQFHMFLYKMHDIFLGTALEKNLSSLLESSAYLAIDISKFPLNQFSEHLYIPAMAGRRGVLDRLFL